MMSEDLEANGSHKVRQTLLAKSKLKEASRISTLLSGQFWNSILPLLKRMLGIDSIKW